jgi:Flp pilus assembly protein TadD
MLAVQRYEVGPETLMLAVDAGVPPIVLRADMVAAAVGKYHYSVLTAYDWSRQTWIAHDGYEADVLLSFETLEAEHQRADRWTLLVVSPDARPQGLPHDVHLELGLQAEQAGLSEAARHHYQQAAWTPSSAQAVINLSNIALTARDFDRAEVLLRSVLVMAPGSADARNNLAWVILQRGGDLNEAETLAREASGDEKVRGFALDTLAEVLASQGRVEEASQVRGSIAPAP